MRSIRDTTMFCRGCGYPLDQLSGHRCPECWRTYDPDDVTTFRRDRGDLVRLVTTGDAGHAHALRLRLVAHGIDATVVGEALAGGEGMATPFEVWVGAEQAPRALRLVTSPGPEHDETGEPGPGWSCPRCGEAIEDQFTDCWRCETPRSA